ncbi:hypothetical protein AB4605_21125 [Vibrio cyclitrophicus]
MSDFTAIGQLVTEARNLLDSIKGGAIRTMQTTFDNLLSSFDSRMNKAVTNGIAKINAVTSGATALPEATFQELVKTSGKVWGKHRLMSVSPPNFVDPAHADYKTGQRNGILLWPIGEPYDSIPLSYGFGFDGEVSATRTGYAKQVKGLKLICLRHYLSTYLSVGSENNTIGLKIGTFDYMGKTYQTLISSFSGGGTVLLDGFVALRGKAGFQDENFGRYINDKDNTVLDDFSPIVTVPYK